MSNRDNQDKLALAQLLMVDITIRLEAVTELAANQQRARVSNPELVDGVATVMDLLTAYGHILARRSSAAR